MSDNSFFNFDRTDGQYEFSSLEAVRRAALITYGRFVAHLNNLTPDDKDAETKTQYLTLQETEHIVKEHAHIFENEYAIGGDTPEEAENNIRELMAALLDRVMSNVLQAGVKNGLLDCSFDADTADFVFSPTDAGAIHAKTCIENLKREQNNRTNDS